MSLWRRRTWVTTAAAVPTATCHKITVLTNRLLTTQSLSATQSKNTYIKISPEQVLSTLKKSPSDWVSLSFFLWCARQSHHFHHRQGFDHLASVVTRLVEESGSSVKGLIDRLQGFEGENVVKAQTLMILLRIFWHGGMFDLVFQLFDEMPNYGFTPNTYARNILIDVLFKIGRIDMALEVLRDTEKPNFLTFSIAICNLCRLGDLVNAKGVLRRMLRNGYYLNDVTFWRVLDCFCKLGRISESLQIFGMMISLGIPISVNTWSVLIDGFCKSGNIVMADYLFEKMVKSDYSPNVVTYTSLIKGLMKSKMSERALYILSTMESKGCAPDLVLCNVLIDSLSKLGWYNDALDVYFSLPKWNLVPDSYTLSAIIATVCLSKQFDLLPLLISGICFQVDLVVSNSLLSYFCKAGYPFGAVELYNDMIIRGFVPDRYSYAGLLTGLCESGRFREAINVYNAIVEKGSCVDPHIHSIIVDKLSSSGKLQTAMRLFRNAIEHKYPLDVVSYTAVIQGLVKGGRLQEACDLFRRMTEEGVTPNAYTYSVMISGFCRVRDIKMVREILYEMTEEGIVVDYHICYMVKNLVFRSCCTPSSFNLLIEMCHSNSVLDKALGAIFLKGLSYRIDRGYGFVDVQNVDSSSSEESDVAVAVAVG